MELSKLDTTMINDLSNQISLNILSNHNELHVVWKEKDDVIMLIHYCKDKNQLKILEGSLGSAINCSILSESEKISRCYDAIQKVIMTQKNLARIRMQKALISRNNEFIGINQKLIDRPKIT